VPITAKQIADAAGWVLLGIVIVFFGWLFSAADWTPGERRRLYAIAALFVASLIFWSQFEQAGSTLNLFGDRNTRTEVFGWTFPSSYYQTLQPLFIILRAGLRVGVDRSVRESHRAPRSFRSGCSSWAPASP
jgi:Dipeptide/tripeptide permease